MAGINGIYPGLIKGVANAISYRTLEREQAVKLFQYLAFLKIPCDLFYDAVIAIQFKIRYVFFITRRFRYFWFSSMIILLISSRVFSYDTSS